MRGARDGADMELVWRVATDQEREEALRVAQAVVSEYLAAVGNSV